MKNKQELKKLLNLNFLDVSNKSFSVGKYDLPYVECNPPVLPDYIANYDEPGLYHKTNLTAVGFYNYDSVFDGKNGIFNAIYYNDKKWLDFYKQRLKNVRFIIAPDITQAGDIPRWERNYRFAKSRIISVWAVEELKAIVIPNLTFTDEESFAYMIEGMENCSVVAFSLTGILSGRENEKTFKKAVRYAVDNLPLQSIVVFATSRNDRKINKLFEYAIKQNKNIVIPDNTLLLRNKEKES